MAYNIFNQIAQNAMAANRQQASKANPNQVIAKQPNAIAGATNMLPGLTDNPMVTRQYQAAAGQQGNGGTAFRTYEPTVQTTPAASTWRGKTSAPDGGFFDWAGRTYTTPEQEAQYKRQSMSRMGIMALGDALRHLGNIYHTTKYAPSQQFNAPVQQEYAMYKAGKAERDKDNYAIQQQKLAQAKWDADQAYKAAQLGWKAKDYELKEKKYNDDNEHWQKKFDNDNEHWKTTFDYNKEKNDRDYQEKVRMNDNTIRHQKVTEAQGQQNINLRAASLAETRRHHGVIEANSDGGGGGSRSGGGANAKGQKVYYSGAFGSVSRNQNMTVDEARAMVDHLHTKGWVTDKKYAEFLNAMNSGNTDNLAILLGGVPSSGNKGVTGGIIQSVLTYHKDGAKFLADNYNFNITGPGDGVMAKTTRTVPKSVSATAQKSTPASQQQKAAPEQKSASAPQQKQQVRANQQTVNNAKKAVSGAKSRTQQNADILSSGNKNKKPLEV